MSDWRFKLQNVLTGCFSLLSLIYLVMMALLVDMIFRLNGLMSAVHAPSFVFIALFPHVLSLPLLYMTASLTFFHISLKIREGSRLSFILSLIFIMALPLPLLRVAMLTINPLIQQFGFATQKVSFQLWNYIALSIAGLTLIILMISYSQFTFEGRSLPMQSKKILGLFCLLIVVPMIVFSAYVYYQSHHQDYQYRHIQSQVAFHIYQPAYLPEGRTYETTFFIPRHGLLTEPKTVQVDFNYSMKDIMNGKKSGLISMKQTKITEDFRLNKFISEYKKEIVKSREIKLKNAKDKRATLKEDKGGKYLVFITPKNTLLVISAFYISDMNLLHFAESLY